MNQSIPKWEKRLVLELKFRELFTEFSLVDWEAYLRSHKITSYNHDTLVSLDLPHYCQGATVACGGPQGWCYTFQGRQATKNHHIKVAMVDMVARQYPDLFADKAADEVNKLVQKKMLNYPNLRYSGSGEVSKDHICALRLVQERGIHLWGFSRSLAIANSLISIGASAIFSCDYTTSNSLIKKATSSGISMAYTSKGVDDHPPDGTFVTFPLHRGGVVNEVVESDSLCPKVVEEFFSGKRRSGTCQNQCNRCHNTIDGTYDQ